MAFGGRHDVNIGEMLSFTRRNAQKCTLFFHLSRDRTRSCLARFLDAPSLVMGLVVEESGALNKTFCETTNAGCPREGVAVGVNVYARRPPQKREASDVHSAGMLLSLGWMACYTILFTWREETTPAGDLRARNTAGGVSIENVKHGCCAKRRRCHLMHRLLTISHGSQRVWISENPGP